MKKKKSLIYLNAPITMAFVVICIAALALDYLTAGRTTIAIAHRLSTLRGANRLVVIDGHRIAEIGTHNELMEKKGIYYNLG